MFKENPATLTRLEITGFRSISHAVAHFEGNLVIFGTPLGYLETFEAIALFFKEKEDVSDYFRPSGFNPWLKAGSRVIVIEMAFKHFNGEEIKARISIFEKDQIFKRELNRGGFWYTPEDFFGALPVFTKLTVDDDEGPAKILNAYEEGIRDDKRGAIVLIDRPGVHLDSEDLKDFGEELKQLESPSFQVIIAANSPELINWGKNLPALRCSAKDGRSYLHQPAFRFNDHQLEELEKITLTISAQELSRALTGRRTILVEGLTEHIALRSLSGKLEITQSGVALINAKGIYNFHHLIQMMELIALEYVAIHDLDGKNTYLAVRNENVRKEIKTGTLIILDKDFEAVAEVPNIFTDKIENVKKWLERTSYEDIPVNIQELTRICYGPDFTVGHYKRFK